jgi:wyosine [tRNA(Phe)-imidazoG37] synthetase (radical SAM superfamily)
MVGEKKNIESDHNLKFPRTLLIENTSNCNLNCLSCRRELINKNRKSRHINLEYFEIISRSIQQLEVKNVAFMNFGEPFLSNSIMEEITILRKNNPNLWIETCTNGMLVNNEYKLKSALLFDKIRFSIDGATNESVRYYQKGSNFETVYKNMSSLAKLKKSHNLKRPIIEWKYVLFKWNDSRELISKAVKMAKVANIDSICFYPTLTPFYAISYKYYLGLKYLRPAGNKIGFPNEIKLN